MWSHLALFSAHATTGATATATARDDATTTAARHGTAGHRAPADLGTTGRGTDGDRSAHHDAEIPRTATAYDDPRRGATRRPRLRRLS